jgi:hypothetical protein
VLRFICRFLGVWLLAAALVFAVIDGAKTIAAAELVTTPVMESWAMVAGAGAEEAGGRQPIAAPWPLDIAAAWLLVAPTSAALLVIAVILLIVGRRRRPQRLTREFAT